jgi:hypothetical protein
VLGSWGKESHQGSRSRPPCRRRRALEHSREAEEVPESRRTPNRGHVLYHVVKSSKVALTPRGCVQLSILGPFGTSE